MQLPITTRLFMTKRQAKKVDMYALIVLFFAKFDNELNGFQPLVDQITIFLLKFLPPTLSAQYTEQITPLLIISSTSTSPM